MLPNLVTGEDLGFTYSPRSIFDKSVSGQPMKIEFPERIFEKIMLCLKWSKKFLIQLRNTPGFRFCTDWNEDEITTNIGKIDIIRVRLRVYRQPERAHLAITYKKNFIEGFFFQDEGVVQNEAREMRQFLTKLFMNNEQYKTCFDKTTTIFSTLYRASWDLPAEQADQMMRENRYGYNNYHTHALISLVEMPIWDEKFRNFNLFTHVSMRRLICDLNL